MASVSLFCMTFILSSSITLATVDVFQSQDRSVCYGMMATVTCVTTTMNGRLQWVIDNAPVFTVTSGRTDNFNETTDGSEFVFVRGILESGVYVYTSTVSLNTNQTTSIRCLDGSIPQTLDVNLVVESSISSISGNNGDDPDSVVVTWSPPNNTGICCYQYHVVTSNGTTVNTSETSFDVSRDNSYVSICCMDQIGTKGPAFVYRPTFAPTDPPPPSSSFSPTTDPSPTTDSVDSTDPSPSSDAQSDPTPWWAWLIIGISFLLLAIYAFMMTVLYIYEKSKPKDNNSIKHGVELDEQKL